MVQKEVFFASGKRADVFVFEKGKKVFAVKRKRKKSEAQGRMENEVRFLKIVNKYGIGPRVVRSGKDFFVYEFVEGKVIGTYLEEAKNPLPMIKKVLEQCFMLDQLGINKLEMHHPVKHIFITKKGPVMIDFERCYLTRKPKNVTQFFQYLFAVKIVKRSKRIMEALQEYKTDPSRKKFERLCSLVQ